jgi:hypothetical protein
MTAKRVLPTAKPRRTGQLLAGFLLCTPLAVMEEEEGDARAPRRVKHDHPDIIRHIPRSCPVEGIMTKRNRPCDIDELMESAIPIFSIYGNISPCYDPKPGSEARLRFPAS